MTKILISDIDNTLYFDSREKDKISLEDKKAILDFQKEGNLFGVCTGRSLNGTKAALNDSFIKLDFMIISSGAIVYANQNTLKKELLSYDHLKLIANLLDFQKVGLTATTDTSVYFTDYFNYSFPGSKLIRNIDEIEENEFTNIAVEANNENDILDVQMIIEKSLGNIIKINRNNLSLDISPFGCDKGVAIELIKDFYNISEDNIFCIGDSYNDISMFKQIRNSYTFNSSPLEVKNEASKLVATLSECVRDISNVE